MRPNSIGMLLFVRSSEVDDDREEQRADNTSHLDERTISSGLSRAKRRTTNQAVFDRFLDL